MASSKKGLAVLASSSTAEFSKEGEEFCGGHGAFTCGLLTGLRGEADSDKDGFVELRELFNFTSIAVRRSTKGLQNPDLDGQYDNIAADCLCYRKGKNQNNGTK